MLLRGASGNELRSDNLEKIFLSVLSNYSTIYFPAAEISHLRVR